MVDPSKISNFNLTDNELEEVLLFWVCAAGKNGRTAARLLNDFLAILKVDTANKFKVSADSLSPFFMLRATAESYNERAEYIARLMKNVGIGCYTLKSQAFLSLANWNLDLRTCTAQELDDIIGIGPKTARAFIVHSRPKQRYAIIDTHILKYLSYLGHNVPKTTPTTKKYNELEKVYLDICDEHKVEPHSLDLAIWNHYSSRAPGHFDIEDWKETWVSN